MSSIRIALPAMALTFGTALSALAAEPVQQHNSNAVWFENWIGLSNASMTVAAPNGKIVTIYAESGTPVYQLSPDEAQDGVYRFELSAATEERIEIVNDVNNGREDPGDGTMAKPYYTTGHFVVSRGVIITPEEVSEEEQDG